VEFDDGLKGVERCREQIFWKFISRRNFSIRFWYQSQQQQPQSLVYSAYLHNVTRIYYSSNTVYLLIYAAPPTHKKTTRLFIFIQQLPARVYTVTQCAQISRPQSIGVCVWLRNSNSIWYINVKEKENLYFPTRLVCIINWSLTTIVYSLETGFVVAVVCCSESRDWIRLVIVRHSVTWEALIISREQAW
jgi:hypothetical protein